MLWKSFYAGSQIRAVQIRAMRNRASWGMTVPNSNLKKKLFSFWKFIIKMNYWVGFGKSQYVVSQGNTWKSGIKKTKKYSTSLVHVVPLVVEVPFRFRYVIILKINLEIHFFSIWNNIYFFLDWGLVWN